MVNLVGGKNGEGYLHALSRTWDLQSDLQDMPVKSALTKKRGRVSFEFFKETSDESIAGFEPHRRHWRGLRIYATDGDQYELPRTEDILNHGYRGYPCPDEMETHYPHMYVVHCYDVLGGVTKDFRYSNHNEEMQSAFEIALGLESNSLTLYDRLFFCKDLIRSHKTSRSFFVARLKDGGLVLPEIIEFTESSKRNASFEFEGVTIQLVKVINPRTKEAALFATNLPRPRFRNREIADLYALRWEVETANRDLSHTLKVEQWHSHFLNGILQEIYTALWLMNQARIQMAIRLKKRCSLKSLFGYAKSNFKLIVDFILHSLEDLVFRRTRRIHRRLHHLLEISIENRRRRSRFYPRQVKYSRKIYPSASTVRRAK
jgi:hypothetical protein